MVVKTQNKKIESNLKTKILFKKNSNNFNDLKSFLTEVKASR